MGIPKLKGPALALPSQETPDLVGLMLDHYPDRIGYMRAGEVSDLAREFSQRYERHITERMITIAMAQAMTYQEEE